MTYRRFLNNNDYIVAITPEALAQLTRGEEERFIQAEQSAEISITEYLSENYEIEAEFCKGKFIAEYDRRITYPVGVHIYQEGRIHEVIRSISGYKAPSLIEFWEEHIDINLDVSALPTYSQFKTYYAGDIVLHNDVAYRCITENGYNFDNIRIPLVQAWEQVEITTWQPILYELWQVVSFDGAFYTLMTLDNFDNNITPLESDNWGMIADYTPEHNTYHLDGNDYVVHSGAVYRPTLDPNSDTLAIGQNIVLGDPRNYNLKKHMTRLALYELTKTIAPNNVSQIRLRDYEDTMKWLNDASKLRLNPQIPRKIEDKSCLPITDWQLATFQTDYDPYKNPWLV